MQGGSEARANKSSGSGWGERNESRGQCTKLLQQAAQAAARLAGHLLLFAALPPLFLPP